MPLLREELVHSGWKQIVYCDSSELERKSNGEAVFVFLQEHTKYQLRMIYPLI